MATIFGDVQYTQVMGHLTTPELYRSISCWNPIKWWFIVDFPIKNVDFPMKNGDCSIFSQSNHHIFQPRPFPPAPPAAASPLRCCGRPSTKIRSDSRSTRSSRCIPVRPRRLAKTMVMSPWKPVIPMGFHHEWRFCLGFFLGILNGIVLLNLFWNYLNVYS